MLATSENKAQQQYLLIAILILIVGLLAALIAYRLVSAPASFSGQNSATASVSDVSAYRWQAMAAFYSSQQGIPVTGANVAADPLAYRWQEMSAFYRHQAAPKAKFGPPGR